MTLRLLVFAALALFACSSPTPAANPCAAIEQAGVDKSQAQKVVLQKIGSDNPCADAEAAKLLQEMGVRELQNLKEIPADLGLRNPNVWIPAGHPWRSLSTEQVLKLVGGFADKQGISAEKKQFLEYVVNRCHSNHLHLGEKLKSGSLTTAVAGTAERNLAAQCNRETYQALGPDAFRSFLVMTQQNPVQ